MRAREGETVRKPLTSGGLGFALPTPDEAIRVGHVVAALLLRHLRLDRPRATTTRRPRAPTPLDSTMNLLVPPSLGERSRVLFRHADDRLEADAGPPTLIDDALVAPVFESGNFFAVRAADW